ncbi:MAG TPA: hypothetical protein VF323_08595 [Candidatus Limnocylindrales bacterium]
MNRRKRLIGLVVAGGIVILLAVLAARLSPLWPGPTLPAGATRLAIVTEAPHLMPALGCPVALVAPARLATSDDELVLRSVATGELVRVVWPSGWAAWRVAGRAELVARDGSVVAREGDVLDDLGGGVGTDDLFHICVIGD